MKREALRVRSVSLRYAVTLLFFMGIVYGQSVEEDLAGFDDVPVEELSVDQSGFEDDFAGFDEGSVETVAEEEPWIPGLTGELTQKMSYAWQDSAPHDKFNSLRSELFLDYDHKFKSSIRVKLNLRGFYDAVYRIKGRSDFTKAERDALEREVELFDAYIEGKLTDQLDYRIGRQVVVWGRSDTIRVTDILNPLDNRQPGMVDIEDLRLPVTMAKFDYYSGAWKVSPIVILEQRFSKVAPFGGAFYPFPLQRPDEREYDDLTGAISIGAEYSGWDLTFYGAKVRHDTGYLDLTHPTEWSHDKVTMVGGAVNILSGSWLFKGEAAYFNDLKYTVTQQQRFNRTDILAGFEYNGIADTMISYDLVRRTIGDYTPLLLTEQLPVQENEYQHAFRVSSDFMNATLTANYLISLYGESLDEGGFQRAWVEYEYADGINMTAGIVDYISGSVLFDAVSDNDMVFVDISYSF